MKIPKIFPIQGAITRPICLIFSCIVIYGSTQAILHNDPSLSKYQWDLLGNKNNFQIDKIQHGQSIPSKIKDNAKTENVIAIFVDSCISCSSHTLDIAENLQDIMSPKGYQVVLVTKNSRAKIDASLKNAKTKCIIICKEELGTMEDLEVYQTPQILDFSEGKLQRYKKEGENFQDVLKLTLKDHGLEDRVSSINKVSDTNPEPCGLLKKGLK
jgi:hypothetical protein